MQSMVQTHDLAKTFRRPDGSEVQAVKGIELEIHKGEIFSLLGPNGAGKTTTISMISGHSISKQPLQAKRLIGVVPQEIALYPSLNARQNLEFFGKMYDLGGSL